MDFIGIGLHKNSSQLCILTEEGELIERRIKTDRESFDKLFADRPRARILVESSTESEWCARHLEGLGHEVVVADPNFARMYATRDRRIKTDKRDARALCEAYRLGAYRPAHRTSDRQRDVRAHLSVRETLIRTHSKYIVLIGALAQRGLPSWPIERRQRSSAARPRIRTCAGRPSNRPLESANREVKGTRCAVSVCLGTPTGDKRTLDTARRFTERRMRKSPSGVFSYWQTRVSTTGASRRAGRRRARCSRAHASSSTVASRSPESGSKGGPWASTASLKPRPSGSARIAQPAQGEAIHVPRDELRQPLINQLEPGQEQAGLGDDVEPFVVDAVLHPEAEPDSGWCQGR